jgi:EAL domain-containing protein (putative c-di-GMP-specific phosphodiesterase class I)
MTNGAHTARGLSLFCEQNREGNHGAVASALPPSLHRHGQHTPVIVRPGRKRSPLRQKVTAVRSSDSTSATAAPAVRTPVNSAPATVESLGRQLKDALALRRMQSISVWDVEGNVQWLNEGALGPDEHTLVLEGFEQLRSDRSLMSQESGLEDGRYALFLPVRSPSGDAVGLVMVLADVRSMGEGAQERIATPAVRAIMQRLAVRMKPPGLTSTSMPALAALEFMDEPGSAATAPSSALTLESPPPPQPAMTLAPSEASASAISPQAVHDLLEFELAPEVPPAPVQDDPPAADKIADEPQDALLLEFIPPPPVLSAAPLPASPPASVAPAAGAAPVRRAPTSSTAARVSAAVQRARTVLPPTPVVTPAAAQPAVTPGAISLGESQLILEVVQFGKLRAGGQSRRFQVQARTSLRDGQSLPAAPDALILQRLVSWLAAHRSGWSSQPTSFTVNLSIATLEDERFAQRMAGTLNSNGLSPEVLGFEIAEALCTQRRALVERFITQCEKVGSWVVVDDFSFDSQVLPLLRSKAVRLVKLDHKLTASALKDKLSQALVIATVQAVKVLGIHCAAKHIETQAALQWLTAIGCDFAQGSILSRPQLMDSLLARAPAPG